MRRGEARFVLERGVRPAEVGPAKPCVGEAWFARGDRCPSCGGGPGCVQGVRRGSRGETGARRAEVGPAMPCVGEAWFARGDRCPSCGGGAADARRG